MGEPDAFEPLEILASLVYCRIADRYTISIDYYSFFVSFEALIDGVEPNFR